MAVIPHSYRRRITPDYDARPDAGIVADLHVANEAGRVSDKG
jgi:hypothetical protein